MKVKFTQDRDTVKYGRVVVGQVKNIKSVDAEAFIKNGVAEKIEIEKESN